MDISAFLDSHGFPITVACALFVAIWRVCAWLAANIITPMKDAMIKHLESVGSFMEALPQALDAIEQQAREGSESIRKLHEIHIDPTSAFSSVGTNRALKRLIDAARDATEASKAQLGKDHFNSIVRHLDAARSEFEV